MPRRLLIIDEDEAVRRAAEQAALAIAPDVDVVLAADGAAARAAIARAPFDAVLVDESALGGEGLSAIRTADPRAPVFLLHWGDGRAGTDLPLGVLESIPKNALDGERLSGVLRSAWRIRDAESRATALDEEEERNREQLAKLVVLSLALTSAENYAQLGEVSASAVFSIFAAEGRVVLMLDGRQVGACPAAELALRGVFLESLPASPHGITETLEIYRASRPLDASERLVAAHLQRVTLSSAERLFLLAEAQERARERQEIVAIVSHDLRGPLQTFALGLDAIELSVGEPLQTKIAPTAARMKRSLASMTRLLDDLLDVSRIHDGALPIRPARHSAAALVEELREQHRSIAEKKGLDLRCEVEAGLHLECDAQRLHQALGNVLLNAIRHSERGAITLAARLSGPDRARFELVDTGPGIAPEMRARLFERLYQGDVAGRSGGLGLGLYIAKGIVDAHGGLIGLDSEVGRGTTFWIELPRASRTQQGPVAK